ncbi:MAG TPA: chemotaxis protein CheW [Coriobacteriia bacterium]|nr:chemotaxis protein CheW [Coriobacteriia bacterium]
MNDKHHLLATDAEILRRRAESLAAPVDEHALADLTSVLLFRVGRDWFGVSVADIREIFQDYAVTPLPCVPSHVRGVVNVRGEIISVLDPAVMMGLSIGRVEITPDTPAIVLASGEIVAAIAVNEIGDIAEVDPRAFETAAAIVDRVQAEFLSASVHYDSQMIGLLNTARVLQPVIANRR